MIEELHLTNIRLFDDKKFQLNPHATEIHLGNVGGKSTVLASFRCVLGMTDVPVVSLEPNGTAKIIIKMRIGGQAWTISRSFDGSGLGNWYAASPLGSFDLNDDAGRKDWRAAFLSDMPAMKFHDEYSPALIASRLTALVDLATVPLSIGNALQGVVRLTYPDLQFDLRESSSALLKRMTDQLDEIKRKSATVQGDRTKSTRMAEAMREIDSDIRVGEERLVFLEKTLGRDEDELRQGENIHQFITSKRLEIQQLQFEIDQLELQLARGTTEIVEPPEVREKKERYRKLVEQEAELDERLRELHHLERNLRGISREVRSLEKQGADENKLKIYETEISHIRDLLSQNRDADRELERVTSEKSTLAGELGQWLVGQPEKKEEEPFAVERLIQKVEKCRSRKDRLEQELEGINAAFYEERFKILAVRIFQHNQQIREQQQRLLDLDARRLSALRAGREPEETENGDSPLDLRLQSKRFAGIFDSVVQEITEELKRFGIGNLMELLSEHLTAREMDVVQLAARGFPDDQLPLSSSERLLVAEVIRATGAGFMSPFRVLFVAETASKLLDEQQFTRLRSVLGETKNLQSVFLT